MLIAVLHLAAFEIIQQFSVHWRESTDELFVAGLYTVTLLAIAWAVFPAFSGARMKSLLRGAATGALFVALYTADYFYSWHMRPNLGLYEEPEWVAQHPGFQRELRQRIEANMWRGGKE